MQSLLSVVFHRIFLSPAQGAAPAVSAAVDDRWETEPELYLTPYYTPRSTPMPFELIGPFAGGVRIRSACEN